MSVFLGHSVYLSPSCGLFLLLVNRLSITCRFSSAISRADSGRMSLERPGNREVCLDNGLSSLTAFVLDDGIPLLA